MSPADARIAAENFTDRRHAMEYKSPSQLTIDECSFIGFWLGDGTLSPRCTAAQSKVYPKIIKWFDDLLARMGIGHSRHERKPCIGLPCGAVIWSFARGTGSGDQHRKIGYFHIEPYLKKDGTELFWGLNSEQFAALLNGFWLADGNHGQGGGNSGRGTGVAGCQKPLYDMLQAIGACRGYRFTVSALAPRNPEHSPQWKMSWIRAERSRMVREKMQYDNSIPGEKVWCVTSATGKIITRRKGKVAVVGNTTGFNARNIDAIVMLRPTMSPGLYYQMIGRGFRTHPSKTSTLVLDFCGNVLRHGPVDALKAPKKRGQGSGPETAPAKECPKCHALIHAAVLICPECGQEFLPPAELARHEGQAGSEAVMSGEVADETKQVFGVHYKVHEKKGGNETTPRTMRVIYELDEMGIKTVSEWVCLEHEGFARNKAIKWWRKRSKLPVPDDSTVAVAYAPDALAKPTSITVRTVSGEKFPSIIAYELGEIPAQPAETIEFLEKSIQRMECRRTTCPDCGGTRVSQQMDESYNRLANICAECGRWMMWAAGATEPARELPSVEVAMGVDEDCIPF
jgi:hypothetical protein